MEKYLEHLWLTRREFVAGSCGTLAWLNLPLLNYHHPAGAAYYERLELFAAKTNGYASYRIPWLLATPRGSLLIGKRDALAAAIGTRLTLCSGVQPTATERGASNNRDKAL
ncbi:MAG: hypothetical protein AB7P14_24585 [Blastocatellales bacterium]